MNRLFWSRRVVPAALALGMLGAILAAALSPNIGAVPAQSNCQYGQCPSGGTTSGFPLWILGVIVLLALLAIVGFFLLARRRRPPASGGPEPWQPPPGAGGPPVEPPGGGAAVAPMGAGAGAAAAYMETPEDVGQSPPVEPAGPAAEGEPDIDSLMAELDKISGEILKKAPKTGGSGEGGGQGEGDEGSSGAN